MSVSTFSAIAADYDRWFDAHPWVFESELAALRQVIPTSGMGLEVGVGTGRFANRLGIHTGVEPAAGMRQIAQARGLAVYDASAEHLPFDAAQFDFVLFVTVLCFVQDPRLAIGEAARVVRPNGSIIVGMLDLFSTHGQAYAAQVKADSIFQLSHPLTVTEVIDLLRQHGFKPTEVIQTLNRPLDKIQAIDSCKPGYGEGLFVVIKAEHDSELNK